MHTHKATTAIMLPLMLVSVYVFCDKNPLHNSEPSVFGTLTDIEGNVYRTIRLGNQEWMADNLCVTKYNDGTAIPHVPDSAAWTMLVSPGYCFYNNDVHADTIKKWGALYNWYVVSPANPKRIAPAGWRVPTDDDWETLLNYLVVNGYNWDGTTTGNKVAKAMANQTEWTVKTDTGLIGTDLSKNNTSFFSALPAGYRIGLGMSGGHFVGRIYFSFWWTATEADAANAYYRALRHLNFDLTGNPGSMKHGKSIRLVRD